MCKLARFNIYLAVLSACWIGVAYPDWALPRSIVNYAENSDIIAEFRVLDSWSEVKTIKVEWKRHGEVRRGEQRSVFTVYKVEAVEAYKGLEKGDVLTVHRLGGKIPDDSSLNGITGEVIWSTEYRLNIDETVLMMLKHDTVNDDYVSIDSSITVYELGESPEGGTFVTSKSGYPIYLTEQERKAAARRKDLPEDSMSVNLGEFLQTITQQ